MSDIRDPLRTKLRYRMRDLGRDIVNFEVKILDITVELRDLQAEVATNYKELRQIADLIDGDELYNKMIDEIRQRIDNARQERDQ